MIEMNEDYKEYLVDYIMTGWDFKTDSEHMNKDKVILLKDFIEDTEVVR